MNINIITRKPVWIALSYFYLDVELQEEDFEKIASVFVESPYTLAQIKQINKYEVFPLLQMNLHSVAGDWLPYDEDLLAEAIAKRLSIITKINDLLVDFFYLILKFYCNNYWKQVERIYQQLKNSSR